MDWTKDEIFKGVLQHPDWKELAARIKEWGSRDRVRVQEEEVFGLMIEVLNDLGEIKSIADIPDNRWYGICDKLIEVALEG